MPAVAAAAAAASGDDDRMMMTYVAGNTRADDDQSAITIQLFLRTRSQFNVVTFCVSRRRRKMYCGHARLCVCLSAAVRPHYCTDPDVTWGHGRGCPLVVHHWADLQSVHRLRCYGNITRTLVYAGCARVAD